MSPLHRTIRVLWLLVFGLAAAFFIWRHSIDLWSHIRRPLYFSPGAITALVALQFLFWGILAYSWKRLLFSVGISDTPLSVCYWQQMLLLLGKYVPGKVWGVLARGGEMARRGNRFVNVAAATYLEQLLLLHSGLVTAAMLLLFLLPVPWAVALCAVAVISIPLAAHWLGKSVQLLAHWAHKLGKVEPTPHDLNIPAGRYLSLLAGYGSLWLVSGLIFAALFLITINEQFTFELLLALMLSNVVGIAAGFVALFAPGGIGVREGVMIGLLLPYMPVEQAMLAAIVARLWQLVTDVLGGLLGLWLARQKRESTGQ
ncbi:MAG: flippase-like domain-containing protein [Gammaproteobacteria bacterium]|nr:flippase-like domain-containing protein [Gammaproteobacteria bacterium]